jgi:hypothetical protein
MAPGVHFSPYFAFRNFPEIDSIRVGNFHLDRLDKKQISNFCKNCPDYKDQLCDLINDGLGSIDRFCDCDLLQEIF